MLASVQISLWQSKEREKGIIDLGIFGDFKVERGRELILFLGFYLGSNFGLYSKRDFLTERAEVGNGGLTEATTGGLSDNF